MERTHLRGILDGDRPFSAESGLTRRELLAVLCGAAAWAAHAACGGESAPASADSARPTTGPLHFAGLLEVARLVEARDLSPVELTERMLARIEALDGRLQSYATVMAEEARSAARRAEREIESGTYRGPLHGIPVAVKDLCYTQGVRTMGGLGVLADFVPEFDATVVARLERAGAVLLGKLNLTEGAMAGYHPDFEMPVNPWDAGLWPGASSSGSGVATAAGLCFASLGSDTGGSIRFPSMCNGVVGLKPTYGRVSRHGVIPLAESLDHVGPMARRVADAAVVLEAIAGPDPDDPTTLPDPVPAMRETLSRGVEGVRIGFDRAWATEGLDAGLVASIERALETLEGLGARIVEVALPAFPDSLLDAWFAICAYEAYRAHAERDRSGTGEYGPYFGDFLALGSSVTEAEYVRATEARAGFSQRFRAALARVDAAVCSAGGVPFSVSEEVQRGDMAAFDPIMPFVHMRHTVPANFAGTPTVTLPCGVDERGVPHSMQLLGDRLTEPMLCRIAHAYEQATEWHTRHPPV